MKNYKTFLAVMPLPNNTYQDPTQPSLKPNLCLYAQNILCLSQLVSK